MTGLTEPEDVDPIVGFPFRIDAADKVATAGSCFAQHIARRLHEKKFNYFVTEAAPNIFDADLLHRFNYGVYSARFGNVYTTRQLLQLFRRAFENYAPADNVWLNKSGRHIDPFRPTVQPDGFMSIADVEEDRERHLASVRRMFVELDYFVFTLGLTEVWMAKSDGAAYPICPGVAGGIFDPTKHFFRNLSAVEIIEDLNTFLSMLSNVNVRAKVILTVSPVPLAATAEDQHVLVSNTYSKSVLRVAAEEIARGHKNVAYFPSYEIITGSFNRGVYYDADLRTVTEAGVSHVMRLFFKHATEQADPDDVAVERSTTEQPTPPQNTEITSTDINRILCDEEMLMNF